MTPLSRRACLAGLSAAPLAVLEGTACKRRPSTDVRVLAVSYFNTASLYLADESGYFADKGLRIRIQEIDRSQIAIPLIAAGQADVAFYGISPALINAIARGARVRIAAGRYRYSRACPDERRLYGSPQAFPSGFTSPSQMKGKRISQGRNTIGLATFLWQQFLKAGGLTQADVQVENLADYNAVAALVASGKFDILMPSEDHDMALTALRDRLVPGPAVNEILPDYVFSFIIFGKRFVDGDPEIGARFLEAYFRGARDFRTGKTPKFMARLIERDRLDAERVRRMCRDGAITDGRIPLPDLQVFIDWCVSQSIAPAGVKAEQLVDGRFLQAARLG